MSEIKQVRSEGIMGLEVPDPNAPRIVMYAEDDPSHRVLAIYPNGNIDIDPKDPDATAKRFVSIVQELARPKSPVEDHNAMLLMLRAEHGCSVWSVNGECRVCSRRADLIIGAGWTRRL